MGVKVKFFANLRELMGKKDLEIEAENLKDLLESLTEYNEEIEDKLFSEENDIHEDITIMVNGRAAKHLEGLKTTLKDGDTVSIFPPVGGG